MDAKERDTQTEKVRKISEDGSVELATLLLFLPVCSRTDMDCDANQQGMEKT